MKDPVGAFCTHADVRLRGRAGGPLAGMSFAAKDLFDIAGHRTGGGNPDWLRTHAPAAKTASAVQKLLDAGATLVGKTITDELAFGLFGRNAHYGTPTNQQAPDRVPGGSSSGSAAAVAAGLVDTALGTDTGGSVRAPASYCGLWGIRPTHGRIAVDGLLPLAPSFDTVGCFGRDAGTLAKVADVLLPGDAQPSAHPRRLLVLADVFAWSEPAVAAALAPAVDRLRRLIGSSEEVAIVPAGFADLVDAFRHLQGIEVWRAHGAWVAAEHPRFGWDVERRFQWSSTVGQADADRWQPVRDALRSQLDRLTADGTLLCLPTTPTVAPRRNAAFEDLDLVRDRMLGPLCLAGHSGLPQVSMPLGTAEGCPAGLSVIGARGTDRALLAVAEAMAR